jgi:hypothetical protein
MDQAVIIIISVPLTIIGVYVLGRVATLGVMKSIRDSQKRRKL